VFKSQISNHKYQRNLNKQIPNSKHGGHRGSAFNPAHGREKAGKIGNETNEWRTRLKWAGIESSRI
jgi:hypothetical protein